MNMNGLLNGQNFFARNQSLNQFPQGPVVLSETNIKLQLARATSLINTVQAFWQGVRVRGRTIWSKLHNPAQFLKICKIPHNMERFG